MTAAGGATRLSRLGALAERTGAQALGGAAGGAATGGVEALPELARGEYGKAGETLGENILAGTALGPLISEVGVPVLAAGARQFVKPAIAAKEFLTGGVQQRRFFDLATLLALALWRLRRFGTPLSLLLA
jgi:hypothetical protein